MFHECWSVEEDKHPQQLLKQNVAQMRFVYRLIILLATATLFLEFVYLYLLSKSVRPPSKTEVLGVLNNDVQIGRVSEKSTKVSDQRSKEPIIHIGCVVCGTRLEEASVMLKSTIMFTKRQVILHVIAEDSLHKGMKDTLSAWQALKGSHIHYKLYSLKFPQGDKNENWKELFKPCASQRLFLPSLLHDVDSILYMDIDTLLLRPVEDLWRHLNSFSLRQLAAMAPEGEVAQIGWYPRFARHPFYGKNGVNSGVMLMNLTRMREIKWENKILPIYHKHKFQITWGDQDILNIFFSENPDLLYIYNCDWNFRPDHCMYGNNCGAAKENGISVIHGNREVFHNDKQPFFRVIFECVRDFSPSGNMSFLVDTLTNKLKPLQETYCGAMKDQVLAFPQKFTKMHT